MTGDFLINTVEKSTMKNGKSYMRLKLYAPGGKLWPAVFWEDRDDLKSGQVVEVMAEESEYNKEPQLTIKALRISKKDPSDIFLPRTPYNIDGLYAELQGCISLVSDEKLRALLELATVDERWKRSPAATMMHHAYLGGLLEHTVNLCRLAKAVCELYPTLKRDLLLVACVLHDIGKMDEITCSTTLEYSTDGNLLGHIVIGLLRVEKWMDELAFDDELRRQVRHLIISHHGSQQYGSPKEPMTVEAQVFNNLDGIDANMGKMLAAISKTAPDKEWSEKTDFKQRLYLGPIAKAE